MKNKFFHLTIIVLFFGVLASWPFSAQGQEFVWTQSSAPSAIWYSVASSADATKLAAVDYRGGIWTSSNSGDTWVQTSAPSTNINQAWQSIASSADGTKLAAGGYFGIYTSSDSGATWAHTLSIFSGIFAPIASSADGTRLATIQASQIWLSSDSGATWTHNSPLLAWQSITSSADGNKLAAGVKDGRIYISSNAGATWTQSSAPTNNWYSIASSADGTKLAAVVKNGRIYTSSNSGGTWTQTSAPIQNWRSISSSSDGTKLAALVNGGSIYASYTSTNSGATWTPFITPNINCLSIASSSDGTKLVAAGNTTGIYTAYIRTNPPSITQQPTNLASLPGSSAVLVVTVAGTPPFSYQWRKNGTNLVDGGNVIGSTSKSLNLQNLVQNDSANYSVVITNFVGSVTSSVAVLTVIINPPMITQPPRNLAACPGSSAVLGVTVSGTPPFDYQWRKNGTNLVGDGNVIGPTTTNLTLTNVAQSDSGRYDVVITNIVGSVTSSVAILIVTSVPAKATPVIFNGFIVGAILTDGGCGYTNPPIMVFSGQGGSGAAGYGQISNGSVTNIVITSAGFGYPSNTVPQVAPPFFPTVSITLTNTPAAAATPVIINGFVVGANLTAFGSAYASPPYVTFSDASGNGAAAYAQISNGSVTNIAITSAGSGYSSNTVINIPPAAYRNAVIPSANSLMLGQNFQLQTANALDSWTNYGAAFFATDNTWTSPEYWVVADSARVFFRLRMLP